MIPSTVRIFVCTEPQDMRRSFDGLALATRQVLGQDPRSGALFVFANRRGRQLRVLWWDGGGYTLLCRDCTRRCSSCRSRMAFQTGRWSSTDTV